MVCSYNRWDYIGKLLYGKDRQSHREIFQEALLLVVLTLLPSIGNNCNTGVMHVCHMNVKRNARDMNLNN